MVVNKICGIRRMERIKIVAIIAGVPMLCAPASAKMVLCPFVAPVHVFEYDGQKWRVEFDGKLEYVILVKLKKARAMESSTSLECHRTSGDMSAGLVGKCNIIPGKGEYHQIDTGPAITQSCYLKNAFQNDEDCAVSCD
jgi:hypothetical protein